MVRAALHPGTRARTREGRRESQQTAEWRARPSLVRWPGYGNPCGVDLSVSMTVLNGRWHLSCLINQYITSMFNLLARYVARLLESAHAEEGEA